MEQNFADLLSNAFSDTSLPSLPVGDFEFEPLHFDEYPSNGRLPPLKEEDEALAPEQIGAGMSLSEGDSLVTYEICLTEDDTNNTKEEAGLTEEQDITTGLETFFTGVTKTPARHPWVETVVAHKMEESTHSEEEEEEFIGSDSLLSPGSWSVVVHSDKTFWEEDQEDVGLTITEGQALTLEGTEHPQVRNEQQGEFQNNDVTYFGRVSAHGGVKMTEDEYEGLKKVKNQSEEDDKKKKSDSDHEGLSSFTEHHQEVEQDINKLTKNVALDAEDKDEDRFSVRVSKASDLAMPNMDDVSVFDGFVRENTEEKIKDFLGEDHQEAGESLADYLSEFSFSGYVEDGGPRVENNEDRMSLGPSENVFLESIIPEMKLMENSEESDEVEDLDMYMARTGMDVAVREVVKAQKVEEREGLNEAGNVRGDVGRSSGGEVVTQDLPNSMYNTVFVKPTVTCLPAEQFCAEVQQTGRLEKGIHTSIGTNKFGTVDDSFMFGNQSPDWGITEEKEDEDEEAGRNWEQGEERIKAFYRFYNDEEQENTLSLNETKTRRVQFSIDSLSQIFQYDADSSSEEEGHLNTGEECNEKTETLGIHSTDSNKHRSLSMPKFMLKMSLVTLMGLAMLWWATEQLDWFC